MDYHFIKVERTGDLGGRARALEQGFDATLDVERDNQSIAGRTGDFAEALAAFADKRKPEFSGR